MLATYRESAIFLLYSTITMSILVYWATHYRRELMVVRNLVEYAGNLTLY